ncbi:MAG TPA: beta-propeller fold lactonase family protein [Vicinamibacteria bacterium]|nr:beta-propeller fold lactonase family protein [Vicinamibacteria bacterium]
MRLRPTMAVAIACVAWSCGSGGGRGPGPLAPSDGQPSPSASPSPTPAPVTRAFAFATFGDDRRGGVAAYRVNLDTGALDHVMDTSVGTPRGLAADSSGRFLYTVDNGDNDFPARSSVVAYRIAPSGALEEVGRLRTPEGWSKGARLLAASDRFVYVLVNDSSTAYAVSIVVYRIGERGELSQVGYAGAGVSCCLQFFSLDAGARSLFMDSGGSGRVMAYLANADGTLSRSGEAPTTATPTAGALHPSGRWLLVGGGDGDGAFLGTYSAGLGTLAGPVAQVATGRATPRGIAFEPRGRFAFASSLDAVLSYAVDAQTGALREAPTRMPVEEPKALAADPNGRFLYVGSYFEIATFAIDSADGSLRETGLVTRPGADVTDIVIVPVR